MAVELTFSRRQPKAISSISWDEKEKNVKARSKKKGGRDIQGQKGICQRSEENQRVRGRRKKTNVRRQIILKRVPLVQTP